MDDGARSVSSAWEMVTIVIEEEDEEEVRRVTHLVFIPITHLVCIAYTWRGAPYS